MNKFFRQRMLIIQDNVLSLAWFFLLLQLVTSFTTHHTIKRANYQAIHEYQSTTNYLPIWHYRSKRTNERIFKCYLVPLRTYGNKLKFLSTTTTDQYRCCFDSLGRYHGRSNTSSSDENNNKSENYFEICVVEENDLYDVSKFIVETFGADAISLSQDMNRFEKLLVKPAVDLLNGYSGLVAFAEVLAGIRSRIRLRTIQSEKPNINSPNLYGLSRDEQIRMAAGTSIILAVSKRSTNKDNEIVASIELRLQPCDAKIPFTLPLLDKIERVVAKTLGTNERQQERDLQPYLSNLCVNENYRGKGIGRALVRCVEDIASTTWGYSKMYLHVDIENKPALELYKSEGYVDVGRRWKHFWVGNAADIGYYVKKLSSKST
jgi:ribosomal protein S18 acetylase RimI-like enzyme